MKAKVTPLTSSDLQQQSSPGRELNSNAHLRGRTVETQILSTGLTIQKQAVLGSGYTIQSSSLYQVSPAVIISKEFKIIHISFYKCASFPPHSPFLPNKKKKTP